MRFDSLDIIAPYLFGDEYKFNEAEVVGSAVWLWIHSAAHRNVPLHMLSGSLLPAVENRQFVLASEKGKPVFYLSWASLSKEAERRFLQTPSQCMPADDWASGERIWFLDWVAPFGHTQRMTSLIKRQLFPGWCARSLYHRGNEKGLRIKKHLGLTVTPQEAQYWFEQNALAYNNTSGNQQ